MGRFLLGVLAGAALYHACNTRKKPCKSTENVQIGNGLYR